LLAIGSKLSILFTNKILRELGNKKVHFYKLFVWYLVVKPASVNAALINATKYCQIKNARKNGKNTLVNIFIAYFLVYKF